MKFNSEVFKRRLAALRKDKGWDQEALGHKSGLGRDAIARWEAGYNLPNLENAFVLAETLGCSMDVLLGRVSAFESEH